MVQLDNRIINSFGIVSLLMNVGFGVKNTLVQYVEVGSDGNERIVTLRMRISYTLARE